MKAKPIPKTFTVGIVVGLLVGIIAGMALAMGFAVYARRTLLRHATEAASAPGETKPRVRLPEPRLSPPANELVFDFGIPLVKPDGETFNLTSLRGKAVLVNVWATWCQPCLAELPSLDALATRFKEDPRVAFLLISRDEPVNLRSFLAHNTPPRIPIAILPPGIEIPGSADIVPQTFIVAPGGEVRALHLGAANWNEPVVANLLSELAQTMRN